MHYWSYCGEMLVLYPPEALPLEVLLCTTKLSHKVLPSTGGWLYWGQSSHFLDFDLASRFLLGVLQSVASGAVISLVLHVYYQRLLCGTKHSNPSTTVYYKSWLCKSKLLFASCLLKVGLLVYVFFIQSELAFSKASFIPRFTAFMYYKVCATCKHFSQYWAVKLLDKVAWNTEEILPRASTSSSGAAAWLLTCLCHGRVWCLGIRSGLITFKLSILRWQWNTSLGTITSWHVFIPKNAKTLLS